MSPVILFDATTQRHRERGGRSFGSGILPYVPHYRTAVDAEDRAAHASGNTVSAAEHTARVEFEAEMADFKASMERGFFHA